MSRYAPYSFIPVCQRTARRSRLAPTNANAAQVCASADVSARLARIPLLQIARRQERPLLVRFAYNLNSSEVRSDMQRRSPAGKKSSRPKRQAILILGMHRSGTSALSGVACTLGAAAPHTLLPANFANPHGYWESLPLVQAHNELLTSAGSSWDDWRRLDPRWYQSAEAQFFRNRLKDIVESEYGEAPLLVVKDPRLCRFLPFFLSVLEDMAVAPVALFSIRDPLEVAFSLRRRDGFPITKSVVLWLRHVLDAELHSRQMPRCFVAYGSLMQDWRLQMRRASEATGIVWPTDPEMSAPSIETFLAPALYHEKSRLEDLEKHPDLLFLAAETYQLLVAASDRGADRDLLDRIDGVRAKFDEASDFFGAILRTEEVASQQLRAQFAQKSSDLDQQRALNAEQRNQHQALAEEYLKQLGERKKNELALLAQGKQREQALIDQQGAHQRALDDLVHRNRKERHELVAQFNVLNSRFAQLSERSANNESRLNLVIAELQAALDHQKAEYRQVLADFELSKNALDEVRSALATSHDLSERRAQELDEIGARYDELQTVVSNKDALIDGLHQEIDAYKKHVENFQVLVADRDWQNQSMMARIDAFHASRSYRMTKPLRAARRFFSKTNKPQ